MPPTPNRASRDLNVWMTLSVFFENFFAKVFNLCGRRRRGGGPLAAVPSPAARRAPAAAATAAQIEIFCEKVGGRLDLGVGLRFPEQLLKFK